MNGSLGPVRQVWAQRAEARTTTDVLYLVYVAVLSLLIFGTTGLRAAADALTRPDVLPVLLLDRAPQISTALALAGGATLLLLGAVRGPALLSPFFTATLAASGIPRRRVLWRPVARALAALVLAMIVPAALIGAILATAGHVGTGAVIRFVLAAAGTGLLLLVVWLLGQLLGDAARRLLAGVLAAAAVAAALLPTGLGIGGAYPTSEGHAGVWAGGPLALGALAIGASVPLLDRLRGAVLREQAIRWDSATTAATSMDVAGAAGLLRALPSTGRRLRAVGPGPLAVLYARRDAIAWLRSPDRLATGVLGALAAGAALAGATLLTGPPAWFVVLVGSLVLWSASGAFVDGMRHGVHTLGAPRLFGQSAGGQVLLHAIAPLLALIVLGAVGGGAVGLLAADGTRAALGAVLLPVVMAPVLVAGRARDAAKGPMPLALSTPMPTAQGDLSVVTMFAWQSDAVLLALAGGAVLVAVGPLGAAWTLGAAGALTALMILMTRGRLRSLRS